VVGIYDCESDVVERLERLKRDLRDTHRRIEHARTPADRQALNRQLEESTKQVAYLRALLRR
jgi:hypothetical protein